MQEVLDNIHADDELQRRATALLSAFSPHDTSTWSAVFALSATMLGVTAAGILLQLLVWQLVRPLVTFGTMFVGAWTFFYFKHRASPGWLTRPRLFSIARRTMGCLTPLGFIGYGAILFGGMSGLDEARAHPLGALAGVALAVALLTFTSVVLAGDIVAWSHDGYTDEKSAS